MLKIIVAMDQNRVIGSKGKIPWHIAEDLAYFKKQTLGHSVIMGKNTYLSIGRALPHRKNIVLSRDPAFAPPDAQVCKSLEEAISLAPDAFIIGGASIFEQALPQVDQMYITHIEAHFAGDRYFPRIDYAAWQQLSCQDAVSDSGYSLRFCIYQRSKAKL
ncbi:MAG: dihydrofolate reductase [Candidatus Cloacimonadota bacterium]|nr:dihydrofolate reductase [Candidatus Cloacimonadota bacterium]